jgi:hypothetical protein
MTIDDYDISLVRNPLIYGVFTHIEQNFFIAPGPELFVTTDDGFYVITNDGKFVTTG